MTELVGKPPEKRDEPGDSKQWNLRRQKGRPVPFSAEIYEPQMQYIPIEEMMARLRTKGYFNKEPKRKKDSLRDYGGNTDERRFDANKTGPPLTKKKRGEAWSDRYVAKYMEEDDIVQSVEEYAIFGRAERKRKEAKELYARPASSLARKKFETYLQKSTHVAGTKAPSIIEANKHLMTKLKGEGGFQAVSTKKLKKYLEEHAKSVESAYAGAKIKPANIKEGIEEILQMKRNLPLVTGTKAQKLAGLGHKIKQTEAGVKVSGGKFRDRKYIPEPLKKSGMISFGQVEDMQELMSNYSIGNLKIGARPSLPENTMMSDIVTFNKEALKRGEAVMEINPKYRSMLTKTELKTITRKAKSIFDLKKLSVELERKPEVGVFFDKYRKKAVNKMKNYWKAQYDMYFESRSNWISSSNEALSGRNPLVEAGLPEDYKSPGFTTPFMMTDSSVRLEEWSPLTGDPSSVETYLGSDWEYAPLVSNMVKNAISMLPQMSDEDRQRNVAKFTAVAMQMCGMYFDPDYPPVAFFPKSERKRVAELDRQIVDIEKVVARDWSKYPDMKKRYDKLRDEWVDLSKRYREALMNSMLKAGEGGVANVLSYTIDRNDPQIVQWDEIVQGFRRVMSTKENEMRELEYKLLGYMDPSKRDHLKKLKDMRKNIAAKLDIKDYLSSNPISFDVKNDVIENLKRVYEETMSFANHFNIDPDIASAGLEKLIVKKKRRFRSSKYEPLDVKKMYESVAQYEVDDKGNKKENVKSKKTETAEEDRATTRLKELALKASQTIPKPMPTQQSLLDIQLFLQQNPVSDDPAVNEEVYKHLENLAGIAQAVAQKTGNCYVIKRVTCGGVEGGVQAE